MGRQEEWGLGDVGVGHVPAENIGGHHPFVGRRIHMFDEVDNGHSTLAEAGQDEPAVLKNQLEETSATVRKVWDDAEDQDGKEEGNARSKALHHI